MKKEKKIDWIISLRAVCTILIILIHVINGWSSDTLGNISFESNIFRMNFDNNLLRILTTFAVPCFVMITGALLLNEYKDTSLKKIWKYEKRMLLSIGIFGFLYCLIEQIFNFGFSFNNIDKIIINSISNLFAGKSWDVMWYIYMMLGLYFIIPFIKPYVNKCSDRELIIILFIMFIFNLFIPTINMFINIDIYNPIMYTVYVFYLIVGYAVVERKIFNNKIVDIFGVLGLLGICIFILLQKKNLLINFGYNNLFVALYSIFIFNYFFKNGSKFSDSKVIQLTSKYSFGIYLVHTLFLNIINKGLHIFPSVLPIILGELLMLIITYLLSLFASYIMSKIPILKNIL